MGIKDECFLQSRLGYQNEYAFIWCQIAALWSISTQDCRNSGDPWLQKHAVLWLYRCMHKHTLVLCEVFTHISALANKHFHGSSQPLKILPSGTGSI